MSDRDLIFGPGCRPSPLTPEATEKQKAEFAKLLESIETPDTACKRGRAEERAAIVKWLREQAPIRHENTNHRTIVELAAGAIERGDHHRDAAEQRLVEELGFTMVRASIMDCSWDHLDPVLRETFRAQARAAIAHLKAKGLLKEPG
jgi:broad specificity phosphatase PhoE